MNMFTGKPSQPEALPQFAPSSAWGIPAIASRRPHFDPREPGVYEAELKTIAKFVGYVDELFRTQKPGERNLAGLDSLYLGPGGLFYLLLPHAHNKTAGKVMRAVHPDVTPPGNLANWGAGWTHHDLSRASGIQRMQIYGQGLGVAVNMDNPPKPAQLEAAREAYMRTPMRRFGAEIDCAGETLLTMGSLADLVEFVNQWDPQRSEVVTRRWDELKGLYTMPGEAAEPGR